MLCIFQVFYLSCTEDPILYIGSSEGNDDLSEVNLLRYAMAYVIESKTENSDLEEFNETIQDYLNNFGNVREIKKVEGKVFDLHFYLILRYFRSAVTLLWKKMIGKLEEDSILFFSVGPPIAYQDESYLDQTKISYTKKFTRP